MPDLLFGELVERVAVLFRASNPEASKKAYLDHAPTELTLDLETALHVFTTGSTQWEVSMLPAYLESLPVGEALSVYGSAPGWLYAALAAQAGSAAFYLFDPKLPFGWVQPVQVSTDGEATPDLSIKAEEYEESTLLELEFPNERLEYFQPNSLICPDVNAGKGVILYGKAPNWLLSALVRFYQEKGVAWIAPFYVRTSQAVVVYSRVQRYRPGDLVDVAV
jgi:CRISPR-associated protein Csx3